MLVVDDRLVVLGALLDRISRLIALAHARKRPVVARLGAEHERRFGSRRPTAMLSP